MTVSQLDLFHSKETIIILALTFYTRKVYRFFKLFTGLIGIAILFPIYLLSLPVFVVILRVAISRLIKKLNKLDLSQVSEDYQDFHLLFYELQETLKLISDEKEELHLPKKSNSWYIKPIRNELIKFHSHVFSFKEQLSKELFFDLSELGLSEEEIKLAKSQIEPFKEGWEDNKNWESFEKKYNRYTLQT